MIVEMVDREERIHMLLPRFDERVMEGLVTLGKVHEFTCSVNTLRV